MVFFYNNDVKSRILDGAQVFGKALDVTAKNSVNGITVGASGGQAAKNGFTGVGIYSAIDNHTIASVGGLATVNIQGDVSITATDSSILVGVAASLVKSGKIGVGASFAVNEIERETRAFIGNSLDNTNFNPGGSLTSTGKLDITASNDGFFGTFAAAGAKATNAKASEEKVGLAAAVGLAINLIDDDTRAYIQHATVSTTNAITLKSTAGPIVEAFSIGGAMSQSKLNSIALAGAASVNKLDSDTQAFIANSSDPGAISNDRRSVTSTGGGITVNAVDSTLPSPIREPSPSLGDNRLHRRLHRDRCRSELRLRSTKSVSVRAIPCWLTSTTRPSPPPVQSMSQRPSTASIKPWRSAVRRPERPWCSFE